MLNVINNYVDEEKWTVNVQGSCIVNTHVELDICVRENNNV
jgi:hypothetical protein